MTLLPYILLPFYQNIQYDRSTDCGGDGIQWYQTAVSRQYADGVAQKGRSGSGQQTYRHQTPMVPVVQKQTGNMRYSQTYE